MAFWNIFSRDKKEKEQDLDRGLEKTKQGLFSKIRRAVAAKSTIDDDFLDELEEILVTSDIGATTSLEIIDRLRDRVARDKYVSTSELDSMLYDEVTALLAECNRCCRCRLCSPRRTSTLYNPGCWRKRSW